MIGFNEEGALKKLKDAGYFNITVIKEESSKEIDKVFSQVPDSGISYSKELEVIIKISLGVQIPDLTGMNKSDAVSLLGSLGFIVSILPDASASGKVKSQAPPALSYASYGSTVKIEIETTESTETSSSS